MGMAMAVLISLIIFPLFATFDIENRFNYSLSKLQQMHGLIIQAFLCRDKMGAQMSLAKATMVESMIRKALMPIQMRLDEAHFEPNRYLRRIFNRNHRHIIDLTSQGNFSLVKTRIYCLSLFRTRRFNNFIDMSCMFTSIDGYKLFIQ